MSWRENEEEAAKHFVVCFRVKTEKQPRIEEDQSLQEGSWSLPLPPSSGSWDPPKKQKISPMIAMCAKRANLRCVAVIIIIIIFIIVTHHRRRSKINK